MADRSTPFRVTQLPGDPGVRRGDGGRFIPAAPPTIVRRSSSEGREVQEIIQEQQAPEHPTPGGRPHQIEKPWGPAPAVRLPFRLR
jgi:hypothetical protein